MRVKIGDVWYEAEKDRPIMIELSDRDKKFIGEMHEDNMYYACFDFHDDTEEGMAKEFDERWRAWMGEGRLPLETLMDKDVMTPLRHAANVNMIIVQLLRHLPNDSDIKDKIKDYMVRHKMVHRFRAEHHPLDLERLVESDEAMLRAAIALFEYEDDCISDQVKRDAKRTGEKVPRVLSKQAHWDKQNNELHDEYIRRTLVAVRAYQYFSDKK